MDKAMSGTRVAATGTARGFTLIELMVTLVIAASLITLAVPGMRTTLKNGELASTANDMIRSLQLARAEAVKRQRAVVFCASTNPLAAIPTCAIGAQVGWVVFQDNLGNQQVDPGGTDPIIERHDLVNTDITLHGDGNGLQSYTALGFALPPTAGYVPTRNILICDSRGNHQVGTQSTARAVLISATGRARVSSLYTDTVTTQAAIGSSCP